MAAVVMAQFSAAAPRHRDWWAFYAAGTTLAKGTPAAAYGDQLSLAVPFPYPPLALWLTLPLALVPPAIGFAASIALEVTCVLAALAILRRVGSPDGRAWRLIEIATVTSAPFIAMLVIGQWSGTFLLLIAGAAFAWLRKREVAAGILFGLLAIKPQLALPLLPLAAYVGAWRLLAAFAATLVVLVVLSTPLGPAVWGAWLDALQRTDDAAFGGRLLRQSLTLYGFVRYVGELSQAQPLLVVGLYVLLVSPCVVAVVRAWQRAWPAIELRFRCLGLGVLLLVAANVHLLYYDALLLVVPAAAWTTMPEGAHRRRVGRLLGVILAGSYAAILILPAVPVLLAPLLVGWLFVEAVDLARQSAPPAARPG